MVTEAPIQKAIIDYLTLKRYFFWRNNTGAMKTERSFVRFGTPGAPDIFLIKNGFLWGIEVKAPKGRLSEHQTSFRDRMQEAGGTYIVAHSLDEVIACGI